jgi:selenide,water dikinase
LKKGMLSGDGYAEMVATTTLLNRIGTKLAEDENVHAITDVTGFGLAGHALELARGSNLAIDIYADNLPLLREAVSFAQHGIVTGASGRNWASFGDSVELPAGFANWQRDLLTDPQTSGGLVVSCAAERADAILQSIMEAGCPAARKIGHAQAGPPMIRIVA